MPYLGTATAGDVESGTLTPVLPSALSQGDGRPASTSLPELRQRAERGDAGAQIDLQMAQTRQAVPPKAAPPKGWLHFVAGGAGGMCGAIITSPLDVVKTRLQSDLFQKKAAAKASLAPAAGVLGQTKKLAYHFVETGQLLKEIATKEGPRALFKGLGPTLVGVIPARSINFYTYGNGKRVLAERFNHGIETPLIHLSAAAIAGITTATATNPIWVVKTRLQLESHQLEEALKASRAAAVGPKRTSAPAPLASQPASGASQARFSTTAAPQRLRPSAAWSSRALGIGKQDAFFKPAPSPPKPAVNSIQMLFSIIRKEGVKGLYRGMSASYLGVAEGTIQWVLYERLKKVGANRQGDDEAVSSKSKWSSMLGAAGTAKFVASLITYPHEVVRTRLRQQVKPGQAPKYTGLLQTIKVVLREEGAVALYGGLSAHLLRVVPNAIVMFSIYEVTLRLGSKTHS
ncbi:Pyrimidine nucleotide transporter, mitochondrial [Thecaphora frezii]